MLKINDVFFVCAVHSNRKVRPGRSAQPVLVAIRIVNHDEPTDCALKLKSKLTQYKRS